MCYESESPGGLDFPLYQAESEAVFPSLARGPKQLLSGQSGEAVRSPRQVLGRPRTPPPSARPCGARGRPLLSPQPPSSKRARQRWGPNLPERRRVFPRAASPCSSRSRSASRRSLPPTAVRSEHSDARLHSSSDRRRNKSSKQTSGRPGSADPDGPPIKTFYSNYVLTVNVLADGLGQLKVRVRGRPKRIPPERPPLAGFAVLPAAAEVDRPSPLW